MTTKLEQAARALLAHWDTPAWKYLKPTGDLMADLREALAEQAEQEPVACVKCNAEVPLYKSGMCEVCDFDSKQAEQEPVCECRRKTDAVISSEKEL